MKNVMKRLSLVIICVMMIITVSVVPSFAADDQNYENAIIGRAEVSERNRFKSEARNYAKNCKYQHEKMP